MVWGTGRESSRIPDRIKRAVRKRDNEQCQLRYPGCWGTADEFDHIQSISELRISRYAAAANDPENLRCVCIHCHRMRTQQQATTGKNRWKRQPEQHPGLK